MLRPVVVAVAYTYFFFILCIHADGRGARALKLVVVGFGVCEKNICISIYIYMLFEDSCWQNQCHRQSEDEWSVAGG